MRDRLRNEFKIGDTVQDVAEGRNVGVITIAVASGTQTVETLSQAGPTAVLPSVAALPEYLVRHGYVSIEVQKRRVVQKASNRASW